MEEENKNAKEEKKATETVEENGVQIADDVIATIAGKAASEVEGVFAMSGGFAGGISEVFGKKSYTRGIKVDNTNQKLKVDVNIIVEYGARIPDVAYEIQKKVKTGLETMTGITVEEVNVHVQGVNTAETLKDEKEQEMKQE